MDAYSIFKRNDWNHEAARAEWSRMKNREVSMTEYMGAVNDAMIDMGFTVVATGKVNLREESVT